jgi:hypothetical protein
MHAGSVHRHGGAGIESKEGTLGSGLELMEQLSHPSHCQAVVLAVVAAGAVVLVIVTDVQLRL